MRIFEPVLLASMALAAPAGFVGAAYVGPSFISADFNGFDIAHSKTQSEKAGSAARWPGPARRDQASLQPRFLYRRL